MRTASRSGRGGRAALLVAAVVLLAACGGSDRSAPGDGQGSTTRPTEAPGSVVSTSGGAVGGGPLSQAVEPTSVPNGHRPLRAPGIGVGIAVPEEWTITDLRGDDLTEAQAEAAAVDPQLSGLLADGGALLDRARTLVAIGPAGPTGTALVTLIQLPTMVDEVPAELEDQVRTQVEGYGATDVRVGRVAIPGPGDAEALEVRAVLSLGGTAQQLVVRVVPTSVGLAIVTVRAESNALDTILRSLSAG